MTPRVAVQLDHDASATDLLTAALDQSDCWAVFDAGSARGDDPMHIAIAPDLVGFALDSPTNTDRALVEHLINELDARYDCAISIVVGTDDSWFWAENRSVFARADLFGYELVTAQGVPYDLVDAADDVIELRTPPGALLRGACISRTWHEADVRIVFASNKTDERDGYALCAHTLLNLMPQHDSDYHFRRARNPSVVVSELLEALPVDIAIIDAVVSAHGSGGSRAPVPIKTSCVIGATDVAAADAVGALKMGIDPASSRLFVASRYALPQVLPPGDTSVYADFRPVDPVVLAAARERDRSMFGSRAVAPWLQMLDSDYFPLRHTLDGRAQALIAQRFADVDDDEAMRAVYAGVSYLIGWFERLLDAYRVFADKDNVHRPEVNLGIDPAALDALSFESLVVELRAVRDLAESAPARTDDLRWREYDGAVIFHYVRDLPIDYDEFVASVDVASAIQSMNDYLGGVVVPVERDAAGRVVRQAERNLYLPQPNYTAWPQMRPIDVTKLEVVDYEQSAQRMYWKTIASENDSAVFDDGIVEFTSQPSGTRLVIVGRQSFVLLPPWDWFESAVGPTLRNELVTDAYTTFFDRTTANFEALVEGRDIAIGRPAVALGDAEATEAFPGASLDRAVEQLLSVVSGLLRESESPNSWRDHASRVDDDGFVYFDAGSGTADIGTDDESTPSRRAIEWFVAYLEGLAAAAWHDVAAWPAR